jgi:hypothetical protein
MIMQGLMILHGGFLKKITMRKYKCLSNVEWSFNGFKLVPIRDEDKYEILDWRNNQLDILRQKEKITKEQQETYFATVVDVFFEEEFPKQLLFSFLYQDELIGYGGLVHIDWECKNAEISFLTSKERSSKSELFSLDWNNYLSLLKIISQNELDFVKIYTYSYGIRTNLFPILEKNGFELEAVLKKHILILNNLENILIHSLFLNETKKS